MLNRDRGEREEIRWFFGTGRLVACRGTHANLDTVATARDGMASGLARHRTDCSPPGDVRRTGWLGLPVEKHPGAGFPGITPRKEHLGVGRGRGRIQRRAREAVASGRPHSMDRRARPFSGRSSVPGRILRLPEECATGNFNPNQRNGLPLRFPILKLMTNPLRPFVCVRRQAETWAAGLRHEAEITFTPGQRESTSPDVVPQPEYSGTLQLSSNVMGFRACYTWLTEPGLSRFNGRVFSRRMSAKVWPTSVKGAPRRTTSSILVLRQKVPGRTVRMRPAVTHRSA